MNGDAEDKSRKGKMENGKREKGKREGSVALGVGPGGVFARAF